MNWLIASVLLIVAYFAGSRSRNAQVSELESRLAQQSRESERLRNLFDLTLAELREDTVLLPSLVRWTEDIQEALDTGAHSRLIYKPRPARRAAKDVSHARREARFARRELQLALNRVDLYESLAPWLVEYTDLSLQELLDALHVESKEDETKRIGDDPASVYVPKPEWEALSKQERSQLALDRYCDTGRKTTPWFAGLQYERFVGYKFEQEGYSVEYRGASKGLQDQGIDLVCENATDIMLVQCKRLSVAKELPVRENVVAQVFGATEFYRLKMKVEKRVSPVIVTSFKLSDEAREFSSHLGILVYEFVKIEPYPMVKCNIAGPTGEKIYHLPMDQQYDKVVVGDQPGEFYAWTVQEAEDAGFRRAFRWKGSKQG